MTGVDVIISGGRRAEYCVPIYPIRNQGSVGMPAPRGGRDVCVCAGEAVVVVWRTAPEPIGQPLRSAIDPENATRDQEARVSTTDGKAKQASAAPWAKSSKQPCAVGGGLGTSPVLYCTRGTRTGIFASE